MLIHLYNFKLMWNSFDYLYQKKELLKRLFLIIILYFSYFLVIWLFFNEFIWFIFKTFFSTNLNIIGTNLYIFTVEEFFLLNLSLSFKLSFLAVLNSFILEALLYLQPTLNLRLFKTSYLYLRLNTYLLPILSLGVTWLLFNLFFNFFILDPNLKYGVGVSPILNYFKTLSLFFNLFIIIFFFNFLVNLTLLIIMFKHIDLSYLLNYKKYLYFSILLFSSWVTPMDLWSLFILFSFIVIIFELFIFLISIILKFHVYCKSNIT